jgi:hypothetical protein
MKKILSLVLVIALVLGSFSFAFAAGHAPDVDGTVYEEAVDVLMALGVVNGYPDGEYKPERVVTRAEMAKLLVEALGYGQLASGTAPYSDTAGHWAAGSIGLASGIGLVQGYPDGTFKPDASVSFDEAVTMILRALGYTDASLRGSWPTNYKIKAIDLGLYDDTTAQTGGANRGNVAIMLFNALDLVYGDVNADGVWTQNADAKKLIDKIGDKVPTTLTYANVYGTNKLKTLVNLEPYLYNKVEYYLNSKNEVALISKVDSKEYTNEFKELTTNGSIVLKLKDGTTTTKDFTLATSTFVFYNGTQTTYADGVLAAHIAVGDEVTVVYTEADGVKTVTGLKIWKSTDILANAYVTNAVTLGGSTTINLPKLSDGKVNVAAVTVEGDATILTEIKKDDVVHAYVSHTTVNGAPEKVKLIVARDTVEGKVTEVAGDNSTVVINGVKLENTADLEFTLNATVKVALDKNGEIFALLTTTATPANYALVKATQDSGGFASPAKVQVVTSAGNTVVYDLKSGVALPAQNIIVDLTLDTNGVVTTWSAVTLPIDVLGQTYNATTRVLGGTRLLNDNTVIFYRSGDTYSTLELSELGENVTGTALMVSSTSSFVKVLYLTDKGSAAVSTNVYAVIKSFVNIVDGSTNVQRVTHYLDAVYPVETLTNASGLADGKLNTLVRVDINAAGRITAITPATTAQSDIFDKWTNATVTAIEGNLIQFNDGSFYSLASDVVVYTMNAAGTSVTGVGTISDISVDQANQVVEAYRVGTTTNNATVKYIFIKPAL